MFKLTLIPIILLLSIEGVKGQGTRYKAYMSAFKMGDDARRLKVEGELYDSMSNLVLKDSTKCKSEVLCLIKVYNISGMYKGIAINLLRHSSAKYKRATFMLDSLNSLDADIVKPKTEVLWNILPSTDYFWSSLEGYVFLSSSYVGGIGKTKAY